MTRVEIPPSFQEIMRDSAGSVFELFSQYSAIDPKGRYLHWDEFRRRLPTSVNKKHAWAAVKLQRMQQLRQLEGLSSENEKPFQFLVPDSFQGCLHLIDRLCAPTLDLIDSSDISQNERNVYLVESLMMEEAISSAQLEGAATTRRVAKEMLESERAPRNEDERMIFNNFMLMKEAKTSKDKPLTIDLICDFHLAATAGTDNKNVTPGQLRETDDIVVGDWNGDVLHHPPKSELLSERLEKLCSFANTVHDGREGRIFIHPAIKAIILHFVLGYEHPFEDGNGRTARALFYWYMLKEGYWPFEYISISALLKEAPTKYGSSYLYTETDDFDLTYFIDYQLKIVERAIIKFRDYISKKRRDHYDLMHWLDEMGISGDLNYRQGQLLKKALRNPGRIFTAKEVKNDFGISENTARTDLQKLVALKVLAPSKDGKTFNFISRIDARDNLKAKRSR